MSRTSTRHPYIDEILAETGLDSPELAIRAKAAALVATYMSTFGEEPPFNMEAFASFKGLRLSETAPQYSGDSELFPTDDGVELRLNRNRPKTRQRFSIGHELGHTLFPDYTERVQCRKALDAEWADVNDEVEYLCDVAATEFLFPTAWFRDQWSGKAISAQVLLDLADTCKASPEATVRRFVELLEEPAAVVFFSWKHKPVEISQIQEATSQARLFDDDPFVPPEKKLRVDYAIANGAFTANPGTHIPKDKSIESEGAIYQSSRDSLAVDAETEIDFGRLSQLFRTSSFPIYTNADNVGPNGQSSIAVLIRPSLD